MKKQIVAVMGLGRFGSTLVEELAKLDPETYHSEFIVDYVKIYQLAE